MRSAVLYARVFLAKGQRVHDFSGRYTCRAQTLAFHYEGAWEIRNGTVHWSAKIRYPSSHLLARGTLLEDRPEKMDAAVRHAVEQWIEGFSCGQYSMR